jgi:two-component system response regulator FlrC
MTRILVVDDEEGIREFLVEALELDGHQVHSARDGREALDALARRGYDLVLTDLTMPVLDGMQLLRTIREQQPETQVVVLTAHGSVNKAVEAMKSGAFDFLQKPVESPGALRMTVRRALERRRLVDLEARVEADSSALPPLSHGAPSMQALEISLEKVARTEATVLLLGESGVGKEVAARRIHALSPRRDGPFIAVNCAALSESLLESELFGHEKGAFTGADQRRRGKVELASGGTFFLDEVGELALPLQAKLLRVLQERSFERLGGSQMLRAEVRWVAATNRDLARRITEGAFREDLYHRLAVFPLELPPLRQRREDIVPLAEALLPGICQDLKRPPLELSEAVKQRFEAAPWPGNVRELRNALERGAILAEGSFLELGDLILDARPSPETDLSSSLEDLERRAIERALVDFQGNRERAAERLGIGVRTLYSKLKKYRLDDRA